MTTMDRLRTGPRPARISCPFPGHDDHHPSAVVYPDGQTHCFSCNRHATSLLDLIRQREYPDEPIGNGIALARAYIQTNMISGIVKPTMHAAPTAEDRGPDSLTVAAMTEFCTMARDRLARNAAASRALEQDRCLTDLRRAGIGVAHPSIAEQTRRRLLELGFGASAVEEAMIHAGILFRDEPGAVTYRLARRILLSEFRDRGSRVIYYQARATSDAQKAKYLNPPGLTRPIFGWESLDDGNAPHPSNPVAITEGPFDAMIFHDSGLPAICGMGAHLSQGQIASIAGQMNGRTALIAFDNDDAGRSQAPVLAASLNALGVATRIVLPPDPYKDVGEYAAGIGSYRAVRNLITENHS